jgi:hypothetical protein
MIFKILCIVFIIISILITIFGANIFNGIRGFFFLEEVEVDSLKIMIYRISGIFGVFVFSYLLSQLL